MIELLAGWFRRSIPLGALYLAGLAFWAVGVPTVQAQGQPSRLDQAVVQARDQSAVRPADRILAVVNQEVVTASEVELRVARLQADARSRGSALPAEGLLRQQVLSALIDERAVLSHARLVGGKVDDSEVDRAVQAVAAQNQMSVDTLRQRLAEDGIDLNRFRSNLRDQLLVERTREREVNQRIQISDRDIEDYLDAQRQGSRAETVVQLAQILIRVPESATPEQVGHLQSRAEGVLARLRAGVPFEQLAREVSDDASRDRGGDLGARPMSRLPDLFAQAVTPLEVGQVSAVIRSGAGFHVLKVLRRDASPALTVRQTRVRHILLRTSARLSAEAAARRLDPWRTEIAGGRRSFESVARSLSEDSSAESGGDLGWATPGMMVPEFEQAMDALPVGALSEPVVSRFGVHLIRVDDRREVALDPAQQRAQARNALRAKQFEQAYTEWVEDVRARAYIERRDEDPS